MDSVGIDVVHRCVRYDRRRVPSLPRRLLELEMKSDKGCDVVVQNALPTAFEYSGGFRRNIGMFFTETDSFRDTEWPRYCNLMDELWLPSEANVKAAVDSGVRARARTVPVACDVEKYARSYEPHKIRQDLGSSFVFYFIGEATRRKNIPALVQAFHLEFDPAEPVELVIKAGIPGLTAEASEAALRQEFARIKASLNLYASPEAYKLEHVISGHLTEESLMRLHASCDCFVSPTYGEGWSLCCFDAMAMGKTPITTAFGAVLDYLDDESGWLVPGTMVPVSGMEGFGELYSGRSRWCSIDIDGLRRAMRVAFECREARESRAEQGMARAYDFSYEAVGNRIKEILAS